MDKPISVGDLVQVVRWPCCGISVGYIYVVDRFAPVSSSRCSSCKAEVPSGSYAESAIDPSDGKRWSTPIPWVKRIPPLSELEGEKTQEDIREPA